MLDEGIHNICCLPRIRRRRNHHIGQGAKDGQIFGRMMGHTEGSVGETAADRNNFDRQVVIAHIIPYLLETAERWKVAD